MRKNGSSMKKVDFVAVYCNCATYFRWCKNYKQGKIYYVHVIPRYTRAYLQTQSLGRFQLPLPWIGTFEFFSLVCGIDSTVEIAYQ